MELHQYKDELLLSSSIGADQPLYFQVTIIGHLIDAFPDRIFGYGESRTDFIVRNTAISPQDVDNVSVVLVNLHGWPFLYQKISELHMIVYHI